MYNFLLLMLGFRGSVLFSRCETTQQANPNISHSQRRIGNFVLDRIDPLGTGTFSTVHLARHYQTRRKVAVKLITRKKGDHIASLVQASKNELDALSRLQGSTNVIVLLGSHCDDDGIYSIIMEAVTGGELFGKVFTADGGKLSEFNAEHYFRQMLSGVQQIHQRGIAHRDLKLENAMIDANDNLCWIDFGLACVYAEREVTSIVSEFGKSSQFEIKELTNAAGSASYMSPEAIRVTQSSHMSYDALKADMWSLGISLFAMTTGFFPMHRAEPSQPALIRMTVAQDSAESGVRALFHFYSRICTLSPGLVHILDQLLQVDPKKRSDANSVKMLV